MRLSSKTVNLFVMNQMGLTNANAWLLPYLGGTQSITSNRLELNNNNSTLN